MGYISLWAAKAPASFYIYLTYIEVLAETETESLTNIELGVLCEAT